jgi:hypothetical protein
VLVRLGVRSKARTQLRRRNSRCRNVELNTQVCNKEMGFKGFVAFTMLTLAKGLCLDGKSLYKSLLMSEIWSGLVAEPWRMLFHVCVIWEFVLVVPFRGAYR